MKSLSLSLCFLIDDDLDDYETFCLAISDFNANIKCDYFSDGTLAIQKLEEETTYFPDVIFIDMIMPKINGLQCLIEIRKNHRLDTIPVIICSTSSEPNTRAKTIKEVAFDFIIKPPSISSLSVLLEELFNKVRRIYV